MTRMKGGDYLSSSKEIKFGKPTRRRALKGDPVKGKIDEDPTYSDTYGPPISGVESAQKYRDAANAYEAEQKKKRDLQKLRDAANAQEAKDKAKREAEARKAANESPRAKKQNQSQGSSAKDQKGNVNMDLPANQSRPKPAPKPAPVESLNTKKAAPLKVNMEKQGIQTAKTPQKPAASAAPKKEETPTTGNKRADNITKRTQKRASNIQERKENKGLKDRRKISEVVDNVRGKRVRKKEAIKKAKSEARALIKAARRGQSPGLKNAIYN